MRASTCRKASSLEITSRAVDSREAHKWTCRRDTSWELEGAEREAIGTTVRLVNVQAPDHDTDFLDEDYVREWVLRFADFWPYRVKIAGETINRRFVPWGGVPSRTALTDFYRDRYPNRPDPLAVVAVNVDGAFTARGGLSVAEDVQNELVTLLVQ